MKEIFEVGAKTFGKLVLVNIFCAFIVLSTSVLTSSFFNESVGVMVYGVAEGEESSEYLYSHYFKDGEDTQKAKYEEKGYKDFSNQAITATTKTGNFLFLTVSGFLCFCTLAAILYPTIWNLGSEDRNLVHFGHIVEDKLKGLKIGVVVIAPAVLLFVFFIATKGSITANFPAVWLKFLNANAYSFIHLLQGDAFKLGEVSALRLIAMALTQITIPIISFGAYVLGYKEISIAEKLMYNGNRKSK